MVGCEFRIQDDWAGQELAFRKKSGSICAVWRILGSGRPILSEIEIPVEAKSPRQRVFDVHLRDGVRTKVKVQIGDGEEILTFLNGVRIRLDEKGRTGRYRQ